MGSIVGSPACVGLSPAAAAFPRSPFATPMSLHLLSALLHVYVGSRLLPSVAAWPAVAVALTLGLVASSLLLPVALTARRAAASGRLSPARAEQLAWVGLVAMGLFSSLIVGTLLRDLTLLAGWTVGLGLPAVEAWRAALRDPTGWGVLGLAALATAIGFLNARRTARVRRVEVALPGLPASWEGLRIVQITDVHEGPTIRGPYLQAIVDRVMALQPDLVAITGDLVDGPVERLAEHVAPLAGLKAPLGVHFVTGNHEYYSGAGPWVQALRRLGVDVLLNEHRVLRRPGAPADAPPLVLAGVTDVSAHHFDASHRSDPVAALAGAPGDAAARVLLAHQPRSAPAAEAAGFDLQLSGHTHGGQFWPWNHFVRLQQPFTAGLHRVGRLQVYVSRGTGYWGPPKRLGAPSEITELRLRASPAAR